MALGILLFYLSLSLQLLRDAKKAGLDRYLFDLAL
jgi:hypothetical protein